MNAGVLAVSVNIAKSKDLSSKYSAGNKMAFNDALMREKKTKNKETLKKHTPDDQFELPPFSEKEQKEKKNCIGKRRE